MDPKWTDGNELEYLKQVLQNSPEIRKNENYKIWKGSCPITEKIQPKSIC